VVHEDLSELENAVIDHGQAISFDPEYIDALINRALVYSSLGRYASAIADMDWAAKVDPTYAKVYLVRASAHAGLGSRTQSQADIDQAVALGIDGPKRKRPSQNLPLPLRRIIRVTVPIRQFQTGVQTSLALPA